MRKFCARGCATHYVPGITSLNVLGGISPSISSRLYVLANELINDRELSEVGNWLKQNEGPLL